MEHEEIEMPHGAPAGPLAATVVIPTRNRGALIANTIDSLLSDPNTSFSIVVVDQSTDNATCETIKEYAESNRVTYVGSESVGSGEGRNEGLRLVTTEIVVFTDDDCVLPVGWVRTMSQLFVDERVGMSFCNVVAGDHDPTKGFVPTYVRQGDFLATSVKDKNSACGIGAGMAVRTAAAMEVGAFDPHLVASMDGDLALRMLLQGWFVFETDATTVVHDGFRTWEQGRRLAQRNYLGIGSAYSKPIKARHWSCIRIVLYEGVFRLGAGVLKALVRTRRPQGIRNFGYFWNGFVRGLRTPIDETRLVFLEPV